jgi:hypothetical protein
MATGDVTLDRTGYERIGALSSHAGVPISRSVVGSRSRRDHVRGRSGESVENAFGHDPCLQKVALSVNIHPLESSATEGPSTNPSRVGAVTHKNPPLGRVLRCSIVTCLR